MEKYSYELIKNFPEDKTVIALNKSQIHLIWFLPYALIKSLIISKRIDVFFLCDGLLAPIGLILKKITKKPVISAVMGLDVTYNNYLYQNINVRCLKKIDKIISISRATIDECVKKGIERNKCMFIPVGIDIKNKNKYTRKCLNNLIKTETRNKIVLITVGRLVERKGVNWFIKNVFSKLNDRYLYVIIGDGPDKEIINNSINNKKLNKKVFLLGRVSNQVLDMVYNTSDIFVMPNIKIKNDIEGFGIVAIEAASKKLPVIASNLEGIQEAVINNKNGILIDSENSEQFINKITYFAENENLRKTFGNNAQKFVVENYNWPTITRKYYNIFIDEYNFKKRNI